MTCEALTPVSAADVNLTSGKSHLTSHAWNPFEWFLPLLQTREYTSRILLLLVARGRLTPPSVRVDRQSVGHTTRNRWQCCGQTPIQQQFTLRTSQKEIRLFLKSGSN